MSKEGQHLLDWEEFIRIFSCYETGYDTYVLVESRCFMPWASEIQSALFRNATAKMIARATKLSEKDSMVMAESIVPKRSRWERPPVWPAYATEICDRAKAELTIIISPKEIIGSIAGMSRSLIEKITDKSYQPYVWTNDFLNKMSRYSLGLISSSPTLFTMASLDKWGVDYNKLGIFVFGGNYALDNDLQFKPHSDPWEWSIDQMMSQGKPKPHMALLIEPDPFNLPLAMKRLQEMDIQVLGMVMATPADSGARCVAERRTIAALTTLIDDRKKAMKLAGRIVIAEAQSNIAQLMAI